MPNTREKLIELLGGDMCKGCYCDDCEHENNEKDCIEHIKSKMADHLIANGVTFAKDNNVPSKWIPVTERLPDTDGKYLVFKQKGGRTVTDTLRFTKDASKVSRYDFKGMLKNLWYEYDSEWGYCAVRSVTHWMPLPSPKGE